MWVVDFSIVLSDEEANNGFEALSLGRQRMVEAVAAGKLDKQITEVVYVDKKV